MQSYFAHFIAFVKFHFEISKILYNKLAILKED